MGTINIFLPKKRKFSVSKLGIDIPVVAYDPIIVLNTPAFLRPVFKKIGDFLFDKVDGKTIFDKKIYKKTIYEVFRYIHFQVPIFFQVLVGIIFYKVRNLLHLNIIFRLRNFKTSEGIKMIKYYFFPGIINCLVYEKSVPISFMAFQVDGKTLATSFRDYDFAKKVFERFKLGGFRALAWTSNYFLGYPVRIELDTNVIKRVDTKSLLITTAASVPGYNPGINIKSFYSDAIKRKYSEESFPGNPEAINFSRVQNSEITKTVIILKEGNRYYFKTVAAEKSLDYIGKRNTVNIIYPIALLNRENVNSPEWRTTPQKNISGFLLGYKQGEPVSVSMSSTSFVRMRVNELMQFINKFCREENIDFYAYVHTDDGGAVGDFYKTSDGPARFSPIWGHCFSSMAGFISVDKEEKTSSKLEEWYKN